MPGLIVPVTVMFRREEPKLVGSSSILGAYWASMLDADDEEAAEPLPEDSSGVRSSVITMINPPLRRPQRRGLNGIVELVQ